jgi:putative oxidoreductase
MNDARMTDAAALLLRVSLGTMFIAHALLKYFVFTPAGTAQFFESLGCRARSATSRLASSWSAARC